MARPACDAVEQVAVVTKDRQRPAPARIVHGKQHGAERTPPPRPSAHAEGGARIYARQMEGRQMNSPKSDQCAASRLRRPATRRLGKRANDADWSEVTVPPTEIPEKLKENFM
jgi:hypothetical protein